MVRAPMALAAATAALGFALGCTDNTLVQVRDEAPDLEVTPAALDFGALGPGETASRTVTLTNVGDAQLRVESLVVSAADAPYVIDTAYEPGQLLDPEASLDVQITCTGPRSGENAAVLEVHSNSPGEGQVDVPLTATGVVPELLITPDPWDFGNAGLDCPATQTFEVSNIGSVGLTVSSWTFAPAPDDGAFITSTPLAPGTVLDPGQAVQVEVTFSPQAIGTYTATLTVESQDPMPLQATATQYGAGIEGAWYTDVFIQQGNNETDILWVVDNSCSMEEEQDSLADNFETFMDIVSSLDMDYHMSVVTTDNADFISSGGIRVLDPGTPDVEGRFAQMVRVGTMGGEERGLKQSYDALQPSMTSGLNSGFLRDEAGLRIIYVSDEIDHSPQDWDYYRDYFLGLKDDPSKFIASAIVGVDASGMAAHCSGPGGSAEGGLGYVEIAADTGGVLASICEADWSAGLTDLAWISLSLQDRFHLSHDDFLPDTLSVQVDSVPITVGWWYDAAANDVVFETDYVPEDGSTVAITYALPAACEG